MVYENSPKKMVDEKIQGKKVQGKKGKEKPSTSTGPAKIGHLVV